MTDTRPGRTRRTLLTVGLGSAALLAVPAQAAAASSAAAGRGVRRVADRAMDRFDHGWRTGEWDPFLAMLTDRFSFWFPEGRWRGRHEGERGRQAIEEWARFHSAGGNRVTGTRRSVAPLGGARVLYEYDTRGSSPSTEGYLNWEAIIVEVRGDRLCALHEYWGNVPPA
ncbi:MAG TPA: hypothetical protein VHJ17_16800 [Thermomonospora sp.]|nr:hypothetical protein [Thermomonospora sp.]